MDDRLARAIAELRDADAEGRSIPSDGSDDAYFAAVEANQRLRTAKTELIAAVLASPVDPETAP